MKQRLIAFFQVLLAVALLGFIFQRLHARGEMRALLDAFATAADHGGWLLVALAAFGLCIALCTQRWQCVLRAQHFVLPWRETFTLCLVGQFFNAFMLGATGGDLIKAYYVARHTPDRKTEIVTSVFIDRLIGLLTIFVLAPVCLALRFATLWAQPQTRAILLMSAGVFAGTALGLLIVIQRDRVLRLLPARLRASRGRLAQTVQRVYEAMNAVWSHPGLLWRTVLLSTLNHLAAVGIAVAIGQALGLRLHVADYLAGMVAINLIAAIPLTPSGVGTREAAAIMILGVFGVTQPLAVSLSLMLYACILVWSLVGGGAYLRYVIKGAGRPRTDP